MVMVDDKKLRENRLALLSDMQNAMNRFADISKLAA
jgi:glycyl-tRNA synthetase beta subunit